MNIEKNLLPDSGLTLENKVSFLQGFLIGLETRVNELEKQVHLQAQVITKQNEVLTKQAKIISHLKGFAPSQSFDEIIRRTNERS